MGRLYAFLLALATAWPTAARATTGLEWQWGESERTYFLQSVVQLPSVMWFKAEKNLEARVVEFRLDLIARCRPKEERGKSWVVACRLDDVGLQAAPVSQDLQKLPGVLVEYDERLTGATVELVLGRDGRVRAIDLQGTVKTNRRTIELQETLRLLLARSFAGLDLELPKKGDDKDRGTWNQKQALAMAFPTRVGTLGAAVLHHRIEGTEGDVVRIRTEGRGTLGGGEAVAVGGESRPADMFQMAIEGEAEFDVGQGLMVLRAYHVKGVPSASAVSSESGAGFTYEQVVTVRYVPPGTDPPAVSETSVFESQRNIPSIR